MAALAVLAVLAGNKGCQDAPYLRTFHEAELNSSKWAPGEGPA
jgi:hypothetical protein